MLYLVGLGLGDAADISVKGLQVVKKCSRVYLEAYTSILTVGKEALEEFYGKEIILADRHLVEQEAEQILNDAKETDVAFLVVGDPFGATTHSDLVLRAARAGIPYQVVHNASVLNAVGCCGLQLYSFGETVSLVFWTESWRPESFYDKILQNRRAGLHTLCLLDIKVKEQSLENLMRGKEIYEEPRFMSVSQAASQLLEIIRGRRERGDWEPDGEPDGAGLTEDSPCVGLARLGAADQEIRVATLAQMSACDLGAPLHSLVLPGRLHPLEADALRLYAGPDVPPCLAEPPGPASRP